MIPVVTAINRDYMPGLKALTNSFRANAGPGFTLHCMVYGDDDLVAEVVALGVDAIPAPPWATKIPHSSLWPGVSPAMYARLLIPQLFADHERAIWLDADCVIIHPLQELENIEFSQPVAAVRIEAASYQLGFHIPNLPGKETINVPFTGLLVFNIQRWNELRITERCTEVMNGDSGLDFRYAVQSVLGYVLRSNYHPLHQSWQAFASRARIEPGAKILHWVGGLPWRQKMNNQALWDEYA